MITSNSVDGSLCYPYKAISYGARSFYHEEGTMERKVALLF